MNIVKGVAELIRKTSGSQSSDFSSGSSPARFSPPTPVIHFSEDGDEGMLKTLWGRYENAIDKEEKRKLLKLFLKQFLVVYQTWEPINLGQSPDGASSIPLSNYPQNASYEVVGCTGGHPSELIAKLIEELQNITTLIMEWTQSSTTIVNEALVVLDGDKIIVLG
ncbi:hypothetical protein Leryth_017582 [Lithospermum erythrorhizon]|nr:hypothetical protein Leryth_017582 [Lithospermum erythrorhizon]